MVLKDEDADNGVDDGDDAGDARDGVGFVVGDGLDGMEYGELVVKFFDVV